MRIAVCDDWERDRKWLEDFLETALRERCVDAELRCFASGEALLAAWEKAPFSICFLDIFMEGISGVAAARRIRARSEEAAIIFTTSSPDYMAEGYEVGAVHYLVKPFTREAAEIALERALRQTGAAGRYVELTVNREPRRAPVAQILCAESRNRLCVLRMAGGEELRTYLRLDELEQKLNDGRFLRCHRSFLVNLDRVAGTRGGDFVLDDGSSVPIRQGGRAEMKARLESYLFEKTRKGT